MLDPKYFSQSRPLAKEHLQAVQKDFFHMLEESIVLSSDSNWESPLHMLPKTQNGEWHVCAD